MRVGDFLEKAAKGITVGWIIAAFTDEYYVDKWPCQAEHLLSKEEKTLEIRVFGTNREYKLSRFDIGNEFAYRELVDKDKVKDTNNNCTELEYYDEWQYLDVDVTRGQSVNGEVYSTGGGKYKLPLQKTNDAKIRIRYYFDKYEATGQARIADWRVVEFVEGK